MSEIGDSLVYYLELIVYAFSWAICLGILSRVVFQARRRTTAKFVAAGCGINIFLMVLIGFSLPFHRMLYTEADQRKEYLHLMFVIIPIAVTILSVGYLQFRKREWKPEESFGEEEATQQSGKVKNGQTNKEIQ